MFIAENCFSLEIFILLIVFVYVLNILKCDSSSNAKRMLLPDHVVIVVVVEITIGRIMIAFKVKVDILDSYIKHGIQRMRKN